MPKLILKNLIYMLRQHVARLHEIYIDCNNFSLSDRLQAQVLVIEAMIAELALLS